MWTVAGPEPSAASAPLVLFVYVVLTPGTGAALKMPFPATSDEATDTVAVVTVVLVLASMVHLSRRLRNGRRHAPGPVVSIPTALPAGRRGTTGASGTRRGRARSHRSLARPPEDSLALVSRAPVLLRKSGTAETRTRVQRTPCAEDTTTPRSRASPETSDAGLTSSFPHRGQTSTRSSSATSPVSASGSPARWPRHTAASSGV